MAQNCSHFTHMDKMVFHSLLVNWLISLSLQSWHWKPPAYLSGTEDHSSHSSLQCCLLLVAGKQALLRRGHHHAPRILYQVMNTSPSQWHAASHCNPRALPGTPGLSLRCLRWTPWILNSLTLPDWKINSVNFNWQLIWNLKWGNEWIALVSSKGR